MKSTRRNDPNPLNISCRCVALASALVLAAAFLPGCSRPAARYPAETAAPHPVIENSPSGAIPPPEGGSSGTAPPVPAPAGISPDPLAGLDAETLSHRATSGPPVPILMYHSISHQPSNPLCKDPKDFAREMEWLASAGFQPVTLADVLKAWAGLGALPDKPVVITFDDGYKDNLTAAYPILKRLGFRATLFVVAHFVGNPNYLSWDDLLTMEESGVFDVESHGMDHVDFTALSPAQLGRQLRDSKAAIEEHLHKRVYALCYPSGRYNGAVIAAAREAGYVVAVTTQPGWAAPLQGLYSLHRVRISGGQSLLAFQDQLTSAPVRAAAPGGTPAGTSAGLPAEHRR